MVTPRRRPGRPKGATKDPAERRDELLTAAEAAIARHGPGVSMEQMADAAGVSKATLYDNFDGKRGLTEAVVDRYGARVVATIAAGIGGPLTPHQVLRGGIEIFVAHIERDAQLYRFVLADGGDRALLDESAAPVTALFTSMLRQAGVDPRAAELQARSVLGGIFAATEWWAETRTMSRREFVDHLDALYWPGLAGAGLGLIEDPVDLAELRAVLVGGTATDPSPPDPA